MSVAVGNVLIALLFSIVFRLELLVCLIIRLFKMIGAKSFNENERQATVCSKLAQLTCTEGQRLLPDVKKMAVTNNNSQDHTPSIAEKKGCLLQQIQIAIGLQETYRADLNHFLFITEVGRKLIS